VKRAPDSRRGAGRGQRPGRRFLIPGVAVTFTLALAWLIPADAASAATVVPPQPIPSLGSLDKPIVRPLVFVVESLDGTEQHQQEGGDTTIRLETDVLFAFGSADLSADAQVRLAKIADQLGGVSGDVSVVGYTDNIGDDAVNLPLSRRRADAVAQVLRQDIPGLTPRVDGRGSANPVAPNSIDGQDNPVGRTRNRRVEITFRG
jgi:outer membrane protein OmpA-like peptidoglycan-associated protein